MAETLVRQVAKVCGIDVAKAQAWWSSEKRYAVSIHYKEGSRRFKDYMINAMKRRVKKHCGKKLVVEGHGENRASVLSTLIQETYSTNEAFLGGFRLRGAYFEIFENPTPRELRDITQFSGTIRFLLQKDGHRVLMWDAWIATHEDASDVISELHLNDADFYPGEGEAERGKVRITDTLIEQYLFHIKMPNPSSMLQERIEEFLQQDYSRIRHCIEIEEYLQRVQRRYDEIIASRRGESSP